MCFSEEKKGRKGGKGIRRKRERREGREEGRRKGEKKPLTNMDSKLPTCEFYTQREIINMLERRGTHREREVLFAIFQLRTPIPI